MVTGRTGEKSNRNAVLASVELGHFSAEEDSSYDEWHPGSPPVDMSETPVSLFISYARKDEPYMRELVSHLEPLQRGGLISSWYDGQILPGEEWEPQIKRNLEEAQIILLLISKDFINSNYCYEVELSKAIERHKSKTASVIPVILRSCLWDAVSIGDFRLSELQALPKDAKPIKRWADEDDAYTDVARGLLSRIQQLQQEQAEEAERQRRDLETQKRHQEQLERERKLQHYREEFEKAIATDYPLDNDVVSQLRNLQQQLGLTNVDVAPIEQPIREAAEAKYQEILAEAQRQREEAERQRQRDEYYSGGVYHLNQGNTDQAIADLTQATQLGHPNATQMLAKAQRQKQALEDDLSSEKGIDYTRLRDLLKAQNFKDADQETYLQMLEAVGREKGDWIRAEELLNFPCADLKTIDRLWVKYSDGKFGFSVQKEIYVQCGAKLDGKYPGDKIWREFCDRIGWRVNGKYIYYSRVTVSPSHPRAHLPCAPLVLRGDGVVWSRAGIHVLFSSLAPRLVRCKA
jgi:hypothetical protein